MYFNQMLYFALLKDSGDDYMIALDYIINFTNPFDLNLVAAKLFSAMSDSDFKNIISTPGLIMYGSENSDKIVITPVQFRYMIQREYIFEEVPKVLPSVMKAYTCMLPENSIYYFLLRFADIMQVKDGSSSFISQKPARDFLYGKELGNIDGVGYRFLRKKVLDIETYDEFKVEPWMQDEKYFFFEGIYHLKAKTDESVSALFESAYNTFEEMKKESASTLIKE